MSERPKTPGKILVASAGALEKSDGFQLLGMFSAFRNKNTDFDYAGVGCIMETSFWKHIHYRNNGLRMLVLSGENQRHLWICLDSNKKIHSEAEKPGDRPRDRI